MGRKIDALLGRGFRVSKFQPQVNLAVTRLVILKKHRQVKCSQATSDVVELLNLGHHERALLRVEHVIKEQNLLDAYVMVERYCNLLLERLHLIEQEKHCRICPDELKEAVAGLSYASSRCGDFPELLAIRVALVSRYGKDFVARAIELRNNCGVSTTLIQKLSTKMPSLDSRMSALKNLAAEHSIVLQLEESSAPNKGNKQDNPGGLEIPNEAAENDENYSTRNQKYKDVADAAQAAFESAAYAAEAARAAVELSRFDSGDPSSPNPRRRKLSDNGGVESVDNSNGGLGSRVSNLGDNKSLKGTPKADQKTSELKGSVSSSSSDSEVGDVNAREMSPEDLRHLEELLTKDIVVDLSDNEKMNTEETNAPHSAQDPTQQNSSRNELPWGNAHKQNQTSFGSSSTEFGGPVIHAGKASRYGIATGQGKTTENQKPSSARTRR